MLRIRKLSEGSSDLSMRRLKQRTSSSKLNAANNMKNAKLSSSPYSNLHKLSRTPSYMMVHPGTSSMLRKSTSNSSVRAKSKDSKSSLCQEELNSLVPSTSIEILQGHARTLRIKLHHLDRYCDSTDSYQKYIELFSEIIEKDTIFGEMLRKIKCMYEDIVSHLRNEATKAQASMEAYTAEKQSYIRVLERISRENIELGNEVQKIEGICVELQGVLDEIRNFDIDIEPKNEENWKALVLENSQYSELCRNMKMDIKEYQFKEEQLIKLIDALKGKGYPVDEIYEEEVREKVETGTETESNLSLNSSKFSKIPTLELSKLGISSNNLKT